MKFSILDRFLLGQILASPREGDYASLKLLRVARENLSFSEKEHKVLQFQTIGTQTIWNGTRAIDKATGKPVDVDPEDLKKDPDFIRKMVASKTDAYKVEPSVEDKSIALGDYVSGLIVEHLKALNDATPPRLPEQLVPLYERYVIGGRPKKPRKKRSTKKKTAKKKAVAKTPKE